MSDTTPPVPRSPRHRVRLRVATIQGSSLTVNVSTGGFCTGLMRVLPVGSRVEGRIHLEGRDASFVGQVVWVRPGDPRLSLMGKMGVRFVTIDPGFARSLAERETRAEAVNEAGEIARRTAS
jgi:hypothetical protein